MRQKMREIEGFTWNMKCLHKGKVLWEFDKHNDISNQGEQSILQAYFANAAAPSQFYVRLAYGSILITSTLSSIAGEPVGNGYAPILIPRSNIGFPTLQLNSGDYQLVSQQVTFNAAGGNIGPINQAFLSTSVDNTGLLISFLSLPITRTILNGDALTAQLSIKLQS